MKGVRCTPKWQAQLFNETQLAKLQKLHHKSGSECFTETWMGQNHFRNSKHSSMFAKSFAQRKQVAYFQKHAVFLYFSFFADDWVGFHRAC